MWSLTISHGGSIRTAQPREALALALRSPDSIVWLDVQDPTDEDFDLLGCEFGFHPLALEDAIRSHERPKVDAYEHGVPATRADRGGAARRPQADAGGSLVGRQGYYFIVFYEAAFDPGQNHIGARAINLFVGSNYLVTVHFGDTRHVRETLARWQAPNSPLGNTVGALVHDFLDAIVDDYFPLMDQVAERIEELEDTIFVRFDEQAIQTMFRLKKDLLSMRRAVAPERDVLNVLLRRELPILQPQDAAYLQDVYDHLVRVTDNIDTYRDLLSTAVDSYLSLQSNNLSQVMKLLTMASIVLMSCSLVAGIYGMNFIAMPEIRQPWGYAWALGLMALVSLALMVYFRRRRWL